jgi:hypothetical protein
MAIKFNSPDVDFVKRSAEDAKNKINKLQEIGLPGIKEIPKKIWREIQKMILTERQIAKKFLMMQGKLMNIPGNFQMSEEDAQLMVYGKLYYKNGKLYDNDKKDPACVATPGDEDNRNPAFYFVAPIIETHPLWEKITGMIKELKEKLIQLGIKIGEFIAALPRAIIQIVTSLIALVSAAIILPFGAGIPTAITAVQTMVETLKDLQSKTADILPLLVVVDIIGLVLPPQAQSLIVLLNAVILIILGIVSGLTAILGLLGKVLSKLGSKKKDMDTQSLKVESKAEPSTINKGESAKISASATGGNWEFSYQWTDSNGNIVSKEAETTVTPQRTTTYNCTARDTSGTVKQSSVTVKVI